MKPNIIKFDDIKTIEKHYTLTPYELLAIAIVKNAVDTIRRNIDYLYIEPKTKKQREKQDNLWEDLQWLKDYHNSVYVELIKELKERGVDIDY